MTPSRVTARIGVALCIVLAASIVSCTGGGRIPSVSSSVVTSATNPSGALQAVVTKQRSHGARSSDVTIVYVLEAENTQYVDRDRILVLAGSGPVNVRWEAPNVLDVLCQRCEIPLKYATERKDTLRNVSIKYEGFPSEQATVYTESLSNPNQTMKAIVVNTGTPNVDVFDSQIVELEPSTTVHQVPTQAKSAALAAPSVAVAVEGARALQVNWQDAATLLVSCSKCLAADSRITDKKATVLSVKIIYSGLP